ncbi:MAG: hypothetical protein HY615_13590 [Candidatus Rokubacteria bacterium]|nr:hypothetical protein [Candidatus Rokubacteria bacterium]
MPAPQPRILLVVARDKPELYEYFRRGFADMEDTIKVIVDRRGAPRDDAAGGAGGPERRGRQDMSEELQQRGFVMIHLW